MIQMKEVQSTAMQAWGYDPASQVLAIRFSPDRVTHYKDVPQDVASAFAAAESKGKALAGMIRGKFDHAAVLDGGAPVKCDGNHGGPRCADPECWNDDPYQKGNP